MILDGKSPSGPIERQWDRRREELRLVSPANKRKYRVIVVGTGLAGASAAASLGELGYQVEAFCFQDSPRRAHSIAAQGGINAAKNYPNDGDSVLRLFRDTVKGGDFRAREANVYRLAQVSNAIIDQAVAQGVPFARDYAGYLDNRSFGGAQVSRTFYARGQTGQQLLLGAYQALMRQVGAGTVRLHPRTEMLDLVVVDGAARGITVRDLVTGKVESHAADAVCLATGGYANVFFLSTNAQGCNVTAAWRACKRGALFANPCFTQIHPTCIPAAGEHQSKLTLMSESLRNDGRVWVPKRAGDTRAPGAIPEADRDYLLERKYPSYGNLAPRDISSRAAKEVCDEGRGVGPGGRGVYLDFADAIGRLGVATIRGRYGNLFEMYECITGEDGYPVPMRIYPAPHYTMGGLWVDYHLESTIPGLFVLGEANFSDHGANRLGASALMQGLADGYFVIPYTIGQPPRAGEARRGAGRPPGVRRVARRGRGDARSGCSASTGGARSPTSTARSGRSCGSTSAWRAAPRAAATALARIPALRAEFWEDVRVVGSGATLNRELERAGRVADFLEFAEVMARDALYRDESCGGHFRTEHQLPDGEAKRDDERFCHVAAWEYRGRGAGAGGARRAADLRGDPARGEELQVKLTLFIWRQNGPADAGRLVRYEVPGVSPEMSFLEMLDVLNDELVLRGEEPVAFDHDCREGICGACSQVINGQPHGPRRRTTVCQLHMRNFKDGDTIYIEPFRARAFPVIRDLVVDRSALDALIRAGGYVSVHTGGVAGRERRADPARRRRGGDGRRRVHRLRRLRRGLPERRGDARRRRQDRPPGGAAAGARRGGAARLRDDRGDAPPGLRALQQPLRVRGGLPEGDQGALHREAQPRVRQGTGPG